MYPEPRRSLFVLLRRYSRPRRALRAPLITQEGNTVSDYFERTGIYRAPKELDPPARKGLYPGEVTSIVIGGVTLGLVLGMILAGVIFGGFR